MTDSKPDDDVPSAELMNQDEETIGCESGPLNDRESRQQIGPYRILKELGRGGQGIVFLAVDTRLGRRVALKVLTSWSQASANVISRFEREAAIASKLDHPGICTVFETGEANGAPFMVMQFVDGMSLSTKMSTFACHETPDSTLFLDGENLSDNEPTEASDDVQARTSTPDNSTGTRPTQAAIESVVLMIEKAARALHVAHKAGVIHRDIKPGNIMITEDHEPVILDFGLARDGDSDHQTLTQTGDVFGTPAYMAPEQLMTRQVQVDRRADIWALGVTLFEGLGMQRPFTAPTRDGLYQKILHKDPPDLRKLNPSVSKDLRVIVETALEKDRGRRYQTALDLAEDLRRFRELKPILAKPVGQGTRLLRWTQRNQAVAASLVLVLLCLSGGLIVSLQQRARATQALRDLKVEQNATKSALEETEAERVKTAKALKHAEAVKDFLNGDVLGQVSPDEGNKNILVRDLLDKASKSIEGRFEDSPLIEADIQNTMGGVYLDLGAYDVAVTHFQRALSLRRRFAGEEHASTLTSMNNLALLHEKLGRFDLALVLYQETLEIQRRELGNEHPNTLVSMSNLAVLHDKQGKSDLARPLYEQTLEARIRTLGKEHPSTLNSMNNLALFHENQGRLDLALPLFLKTVATQSRLLGEEHPQTLISMGNLAKLYKTKGETDLARELYKKTLRIRQRVLGEEHPTTLSTMNNLAVFYYANGKPDLALPLYEKALMSQQRILGEEHPDTLSSMSNLSLLYKAQGRFDTATTLQKKALSARQRVLGESHPNTLSSMSNLASLHYSQKNYSTALPLYERVFAERRRTLGASHSRTLTSMTNLGSCLVGMKAFARAESVLTDGHECAKNALGRAHPKTVTAIKWIVHLYKKWKKPRLATLWEEKLPKK